MYVCMVKDPKKDWKLDRDLIMTNDGPSRLFGNSSWLAYQLGLQLELTRVSLPYGPSRTLSRKEPVKKSQSDFITGSILFVFNNNKRLIIRRLLLLKVFTNITSQNELLM